MSIVFDRSDAFAFDKPAGVPCRHLTRNDHCSVHATRSERGLSGCIRYDCDGAGQRVTQLFDGRSWRDDEDTAVAMFDAFRKVRELHALLSLLASAAKLELSAEDARRRHALVERVEECAQAAAKGRDAAGASRCQGDVHAFLRGLASYVVPRAQGRRLPLL